jgi:hypothetical protein
VGLGHGPWAMLYDVPPAGGGAGGGPGRGRRRFLLLAADQCNVIYYIEVVVR